MKRIRFWLAILICAASTITAHAGSIYDAPQSAPLFRSYFESAGRIGNEQSMVQGDLFLTTLQTDTSLLYVDLRTNYVDSDKYEGNFGLGWRGIVDDSYIFGMYGYFDRTRSALENYFSQGTFGMEFMSNEWDFRANGYFPQTGGERSGTSIAVFNGTNFIVSTPFEYAYYGTDLEIGKLLASTTDGGVELRAFLTGYYFDRDIPAFEEIAGGRVRFEMRMYDLDWLGPGSRVMLGAQYQYDDYNESVTSGLVTVRIPFGAAQRTPYGLQRRMLDTIVRDNDIVTRRGTLRERGLDPETNNPFPRSIVVDGSTNAVAQVAAAQPNTMIVVNGDQGLVNVAAPLVLKDGQILRSAGFQVLGEQTKRLATFGSAGTLVGTNATQNVIVLANNVELRDLTVMGGLNSVFGNGVTSVEIHDNTFLSAAQTGIMTLGLSRAEIMRNVIDQGVSFDEFRGTVSQNSIDANALFGINATSLNGVVASNIISGNAAVGASITTMTSGSFSDNQFTGTVGDGVTINSFNSGTFDNNQFTNVTNRGVAIASMAGGTISNTDIQGTPVTGIAITTMSGGTLTENVVSNATQDAFAVGTLSGGTIDLNVASSSGQHGFNIGTFLSGNVTTNVATGNAGSGFEFGLLNSNIVDGDISGNRATGNGVGFNIASIIGSPTISQNTANSNIGAGFVVASATGAMQFDSNVANNNGGVGFSLPTIANGFVTSNTANSNAGAGMTIAAITNGSITGNSFASNGAGGLVIGNINVGSVSNNTATGNTGAGITMGVLNNGSFNGNTSTGNTGHGFSIVDFDFGTMSNNTADANGGDGFNFAEFTNGTLSASSASNNTGNGFFVATYDGGILSDINGNTADSNGVDGFNIGSIGGWSGGAMTSNVSTDNVGFGYNIQNRTGGTAVGNTATGNADNTLP
ncbi:MAG: right-handed parallel beta-helix repeat-containing protein [Planctomycetales bacterium]|nr:right-handed parallel beta-helix repeat-containing protein [Planctomycetales bacterium]